MYTRTVTFRKIAHVVEYDYDEGQYLKLRKVTPPVSDDLHDELCEAVDADHNAEETAHWKQLYDGEVQAGLHDPNPD